MADSTPRGWPPAAQNSFLQALAETGVVKDACAALGVSAQAAYALRKRGGEFARRWEAVMAQIDAARAAAQAAGVARSGMLADYRVRHDGWTEARQKAFLRALAETGCVRDACKRVRISSTSAYRARRHSPEFARAWNRAQAAGGATIEQAAFARAVEGWDEVVMRDGKVVSSRRRYSDSLLRLLLQRGDLKNQRQGLSSAELEQLARETAEAAGGSFRHHREDAEVRARLMAKFAAMGERLRAGEDGEMDWAPSTPCGACGGTGRVDTG
jgi:hypothetical protein